MSFVAFLLFVIILILIAPEAVGACVRVILQIAWCIFIVVLAAFSYVVVFT